MMLMHHIKEQEMLAAFIREGVFVGADAMPLFDEQGQVPPWDAAYGVGKGHPRSAGTHAKILRMVRESQAIPLMEAIAKLSYLQFSGGHGAGHETSWPSEARLHRGHHGLQSGNGPREFILGTRKVQSAVDGDSLCGRQWYSGSERLKGLEGSFSRPANSQ